MPNSAQEIIDLLEARASSGRAAFQISKATFTKIIALLQQRFGVSCLEAELLFADIIREHEDTLFHALHDHVHLDDAEDAVRVCLGDDQ